VTKQLLWQEYLETHPGGYQYSRFCERYGRWLASASVTMRQEHRAGEKSFVDFSGDGVQVVDTVTGEVRVAKLFVAVLGASNLTYVEPVFSEDMATWVGCHVRAFAYFGGVTELVVPDNLKAGVTRAHRYEPDTNPTYADLARHYGFAILPARPRRPRDKAKVEVGVLLAERWILAALRHRHFTSLAEVSEAVKPLLEKLNERPMRKLGKSRRELFAEVERAALKPLPSRPYELAFWKKARVNIDYHVELEGHWYSVPYGLVGKEVELRHTEACVEVFLAGRRVASHVRSQQRGRFTTQAEHIHARLAPAARRVDALARGAVGQKRGARVRAVGGGADEAPAPPAAGLPLGAGHHPSGRQGEVRPPARGEGVRTRAAPPRLQLQVRGRHSPAPPRGSRRGARAEGPAARAPERARSQLLPLRRVPARLCADTAGRCGHGSHRTGGGLRAP